MSNSGMIEIEEMDKIYEVGDKRIVVFDKLNLRIDPSEVTVLVGKSGCGKTTLLRLLAGLEKPTSGSITMPEGISSGMVFQEPRLMPWLTCEKNVTLGMKKPDPADTARILKLVGLQGYEKAFSFQLSGGMKQRAALARTLIRKPNLILMDEPFASLDGSARKAMQDELLKIRKETNAGIVFVTHDMSEAFRLGNRILRIENGKTEEINHEK